MTQAIRIGVVMTDADVVRRGVRARPCPLLVLVFASLGVAGVGILDVATEVGVET